MVELWFRGKNRMQRREGWKRGVRHEEGAKSKEKEREERYRLGV